MQRHLVVGGGSLIVREACFTVAAGLHVGAQFVHAVERVEEERPYGVDLHQSQVVQLRRRNLRSLAFDKLWLLLNSEFASFHFFCQ